MEILQRQWRADGDDVTPSPDNGNSPATMARRWRRRHAVARRWKFSSDNGAQMATTSRRRPTMEILQRPWRADGDDVTPSPDDGNSPATLARRWRRRHAVARRWDFSSDDGAQMATTSRRRATVGILPRDSRFETPSEAAPPSEPAGRPIRRRSGAYRARSGQYGPVHLFQREGFSCSHLGPRLLDQFQEDRIRAERQRFVIHILQRDQGSDGLVLGDQKDNLVVQLLRILG